jgi:hypothetical protein
MVMVNNKTRAVKLMAKPNLAKLNQEPSNVSICGLSTRPSPVVKVVEAKPKGGYPS